MSSPRGSAYRPSSAPLFAVAAAPTLLIVAATVMLLAAAFGYQPLWPPDRPTVSEAIVMRDLGSLVQWLDAGASMETRYPVREGMLGQRAVQLTPFEAVIAARRDDVLKFLGERGVAPPDADRPRLRCLAAKTGATDVLVLLGGALPEEMCRDLQLPAGW